MFSVAAMWLTSSLGTVPVLNRLALQPPTPAELMSAEPGRAAMDSASSAGGSVQVGDTGIAASPLRPAGKVRFGRDYVDVVSDGTFIDAGQPVRAVQVRGHRVVVRGVEPHEEA